MILELDLTPFFLIFVRISCFFITAPIISFNQVPTRVKAGLALFLSLIIFQTYPIENVEYQTVIGFFTLIIREGITGIFLGYITNLCYYILAFAGGLIDMEIGFSMANVLDPATNIRATITANYYTYMVILMMLITNLHHHFIVAIIDSFKVVPLGGGQIQNNLFELAVKILRDYFIIGFRIILPFFAAILIVNVLLGILIKVVPQLNMFVIGIQLKIIVGLSILFILVGTLPTISEYIFDKMFEMFRLAIEVLQ
ncbi:MAG: flagellar biosynthetic protein FliR [Clostridiales bacterium]|nr:flagellar biosynthetic protein FliR [Clostridiales bacterium]